MLLRAGKHAYIGMGFTDRSHAFDFNAAIQDFWRELNAEKEVEAVKEQPKLDLTLKEGQTIKVSIGGKGGKKKAKPQAGGGGGGGGGMGGLLAPPPANPASTGAAAAAAAAADFGDFGDFAAAPAPAPQAGGGGGGGGEDDWTSFDD